MTCAFALALPNVSIVCSDTRINAYYGEVHKPNDSGMLTVEYPDGSSYSFADKHRKLAMIPGGCAAGAGCFPLVRASLDQLRTTNFKDYPEFEQVLRRTYDREVSKIKSWWKQDSAQIDRSTILVSKADGPTFRLYAYSFGRQPANQGNYYLITPPEFQGSANQLKSNFEAKLQGTCGIGLVIRCLAELFHEVSLDSQTVSDRLDLIVLSVAGRDLSVEVMTEENVRLMSLNDGQIEGLLRRI